MVAFGTADKKGNPNVVPILWKTILNDKTILLLDNFMKKNQKEIFKRIKKVCVSFWNTEPEEAYKIKGTAKYHQKGTIYEKGQSIYAIKKTGKFS